MKRQTDEHTQHADPETEAEVASTSRPHTAVVVEEGRDNRAVGTRMLYSNDRVRIWEIDLKPGERAPFHCHEGDYFWTCVEASEGRTTLSTGRSYTQAYANGQTSYFSFAPGEYMVHDLQNVGDSHLRFVTVELLTAPDHL